jgi:uncharacterized membrane protein YhhN
MNRRATFLLWLYTFFVFLDLFFLIWQKDNLRWFSKPLLMPVLIAAFFASQAQKKGKAFSLVLLALFLSWCGDVLLQAKDLFIPGLLSFLLAHVAYIIYFRSGSAGHGLLQKRPVLFLPVLLYIGLLLVLLFPHLGGLKIPVILYSATIGAMLLMALNTKHRLPASAASLFISGALLFVISDSLLAVNLFVVKHWIVGPFVMASYAAAQYLIVSGAMVHRNAVDEHPAFQAGATRFFIGQERH